MQSSCVCDSITEQASTFPDRLAVQDGERSLTYHELDSRADLLAHAISAAAANRDRPVGVLLPPSSALIIAELGVMKAGLAFLPIDPGYPLERILFVLREAQIEVVVTRSSPPSPLLSVPSLSIVDVDQLAGTEVVDRLPAAANDPASLAYVIFTSGSTGKPKGVMVEHRNLSNLIRNFQLSLCLSANARSSVTASPAFDASIAEIWPYLATGASVHIAPRELKIDPAGMLNWLKRERITVSLLPTALVEIMLARQLPDLPDLRVLITGGEQLHKAPAAALPFRFLNAYGPTECTVISTWGEVMPALDARWPPSIGRPLNGVYVRVLDQDLEAVPEGVAGEIYIGGAGVARGYLNAPELTSKAFISDPLAPTGAARLYRSGDIGCWRNTGELAFLGRRDRQVQLHGFRIEPAEIEFVLKLHEGIEDAAVALQEDPPITRLVAFLAIGNKSEGSVIPAIRERVKAALPAHMHPALYVEMERLPLTASGKIDYARLPMPGRDVADIDVPHGSNDGSHDGSNAEQVVRKIWRSVLTGECEDVDSFFDAGGDSLAMMVMLGEVERQLSVTMPVAAFLRSPTLRHCVAMAKGGGDSGLPACTIELSAGSGNPFFCAGGAGGGVHQFAALARASALNRPFYGLESQGLPGELQKNFSIQNTARYFLEAIRELQPAGPYHLGGYSLGGLVAMEIAHALLDAGEEVRPIVLIDTYAEIVHPSAAARLWSLMDRLVTEPFGESKEFVKDRLEKWHQRSRSRATHSPEFEEIEFGRGNQTEATFRYLQNGFAPCRVPVRLIVSRYGSEYAPRAKDRGWSRFAGAGLEVRQVPGDHFSILEEPHVSALGAQLREFVEI